MLDGATFDRRNNVTLSAAMIAARTQATLTANQGDYKFV
jgi:hypothetical protein